MEDAEPQYLAVNLSQRTSLAFSLDSSSSLHQLVGGSDKRIEDRNKSLHCITQTTMKKFRLIISIVVQFFLCSAHAGTSPVYSDLWWNQGESGWGIVLNHQSDIIFAAWYTYGTDNKALWYVIDTRRQADGSFTGPIYQTTGIAFNQIAGQKALTSITTVGTARFHFGSANAGIFSYTIGGVDQFKTITRQQYTTTATTCTAQAATTGSRANSQNYQDLWWVPAESGWGINITHQSDILFVAWFTYAADGSPQWVVGSRLERQADGSFTGALHRTTGTPMAQIKGLPATNSVNQVGNIVFRFNDGERGVMTYTLDHSTSSKNILRQVFGTTVNVCTNPGASVTATNPIPASLTVLLEPHPGSNPNATENLGLSFRNPTAVLVGSAVQTTLGGCAQQFACIARSLRETQGLLQEANAADVAAANSAQLVLESIGNLTAWCSATLVKNKASPKPLLVTARHCVASLDPRDMAPSIENMRVVFGYSLSSCTAAGVVAPLETLPRYRLRVLGVAADVDVALLEIVDAPTSMLSLGSKISWNEISSQSAERVVNIAHPIGLDTRGAYMNSNVPQSLSPYFKTLVATTQAIAGGSSGSGLFSYNASTGEFELKGVTSSVNSGTEKDALSCSVQNQLVHFGRLDLLRQSLSPYLGY